MGIKDIKYQKIVELKCLKPENTREFIITAEFLSR